MITCYKVTTQDKCSIYATDKYKLKYVAGKIVKSLKGTLGIFCFQTIIYAENFIVGHFLSNTRIYKVIASEEDEIKNPHSYVSPRQDKSSLDQFYSSLVPFSHLTSPEGTICFSQIKVVRRVDKSLKECV